MYEPAANHAHMHADLIGLVLFLHVSSKSLDDHVRS